MAIIPNNELNSSKTWEISRLLPSKTDNNKIQDTDGSTTTEVGHWSSVSYKGGAAGISLNKFKNAKTGETQYRSNDTEGLSPLAAVKVGCKDVKDVYGYSVLAPEKLKSQVAGKQIVISLEELFRASRVTKYNATSGEYECYGETGHLPFAGWIAVRVPKHNAVTEGAVQKFVEDLRDCFTAVGDIGNHSFTETIMSLLTGDITLD